MALVQTMREFGADIQQYKLSNWDALERTIQTLLSAGKPVIVISARGPRSVEHVYTPDEPVNEFDYTMIYGYDYTQKRYHVAGLESHQGFWRADYLRAATFFTPKPELAAGLTQVGITAGTIFY